MCHRASVQVLNVSEHWNLLEDVLITCVDKHVPVVNVVEKNFNKSKRVPNNVKQKLNKRKRLIHLDKMNTSTRHASEIKVLDTEIKTFFARNRTNKVRNVINGSKANLWDTVRAAKDLNINRIPTDLTLNGFKVTNVNLDQSFGVYFSEKIKKQCLKNGS